ncbi:fungal specific zinc-finger transcription factor, partial [Scheffersomyces stipitis CBS 6054]
MSDDSQKKRRVRQACDYCRSKKARCDGKSPKCSTCMSMDMTCTYTQSAKRRGLPTGYIHDLERKVLMFQALFASILSNDSDHGRSLEERIMTSLTDPEESSKFIENIGRFEVLWDAHSISHLLNKFIVEHGKVIHEAKVSTTALQSVSSQPSDSVQDSENQANVKLEPTAANSSLANLLNNPIFEVGHPAGPQDFSLINDPSFFLNDDIFQFISDELEESADNWEPVALQYHGLSSLISGFTIKSVQQYNNRLLVSHKNPFRVGSIFNVSSAAITAAISNTVKLPMEIFQFPDNIRKVVDCYFQIYHTWLPMLDRVSILRQVHHLQSFNSKTDKSKLHGSDCTMIALVWAIMALGQLGSSTSAANASSNNKLTASFAKNAIMALENSFTSTIETIQAQVLLGLYFYQLGQWDFSWVLISSGSRMAIDVRLMTPAAASDDAGTSRKSNSSTTLNNINRERTWATVYIVNTLLAARMGRSPVVRAMDWPTPVINNEGWEEWEAWKCFHSPETIQLNSGRFLSTFNEFIKVISILNLALTSTIDTSQGMLEDSEEIDVPDIKITPDDRRNSNKLTIAYFKKSLQEWFTSLPDYCYLESYESPSKIPPMIAFLHLARDLTWCVLAVRLSALKASPGGNTVKDKIVRSRDLQYTKAIKSIKKIINVNSLKNLKYYPFIDYCILMAFNFPKMMLFEGENSELVKKSHCEDFRSFLVNAALISIPCRISWDLYKIMNDVEDDLLATMSNDLTSKKKRKRVDHMESNLNRYSLQPPLQAPTSYTSILPHTKASPSSNNLVNLLNNPSSISPDKDISSADRTKSNLSIGEMSKSKAKPVFEIESRSRFSSHLASPSSREEIDLFMVDNDSVKRDTRMEKFMTNLGYIRNNN